MRHKFKESEEVYHDLFAEGYVVHIEGDEILVEFKYCGTQLKFDIYGVHEDKYMPNICLLSEYIEALEAVYKRS